MVAGERKLVKGERTRQRLLFCALAEILEKGPDRVGFTSVARRAELTTGALYARYENSDELLVDVWHSLCAPTLGRIVQLLADRETRENRATSRLEILDLIQGDSARMTGAVSLLVAARRNEALRDDVEPSFRDLVDKAASENPLTPLLVAMFVGMVLHDRASEARVSDWSPVVDEMFMMSDVVVAQSSDPPESTRFPIAHAPQFDAKPETLDDIDLKLFGAVVHVVNRAGVDKATVARIARRANLNPAVIYTRYADKDDLIYRCIRIGVTKGAERNRELVRFFSTPMNSGELLTRMLQANGNPDLESNRLFSLESIFAAGHHPRLRNLMGGNRERMSQVYASVTGVPDVWRYPTIWPFVVVNRAMLHGHTLMLAYGYISDDDPCIAVLAGRITEAMARAYVNSVGEWDTDAGLPQSIADPGQLT